MRDISAGHAEILCALVARQSRPDRSQYVISGNYSDIAGNIAHWGQLNAMRDRGLVTISWHEGLRVARLTELGKERYLQYTGSTAEQVALTTLEQAALTTLTAAFHESVPALAGEFARIALDALQSAGISLHASKETDRGRPQ